MSSLWKVLAFVTLLAASNAAHALVNIGGVYCSAATSTVGGSSHTTYFNCFYDDGGGGGGGGLYPSSGGGGGGGSGTTTNDPEAIVDTPEYSDYTNPYPATRCSSVYARHDHAIRDWRTAISRLSSVRGTPAGRRVRIKYNDGSSELYVLSGAYMTDPFPGGPVPGTLIGGTSCGGSGDGGGPGGMCLAAPSSPAPGVSSSMSPSIQDRRREEPQAKHCP